MIRAVILVPTKELALQVTAFLQSMLAYCEDVVTCVNVSTGSKVLQRCECRRSTLLISRNLIEEVPDIIVATPSRLLSLLQSQSISLAHLSFLAIDEADLLLSYGYKEDMEQIVDAGSGWVPKLGVQRCLMSATLNEDVEGLKGLLLRNPVCLPTKTRVALMDNRRFLPSRNLRQLDRS